MPVEVAVYRDVRSWLDLAAEVEWFFGDMLGSAGFYRVLLKHIERGTAFCVREDDGAPGAPLMGGVLFSPCRPDRPEYRIGWLSVAERWRRHGVGRRLVEHAFGLVRPPAVLSVVTFGEDVPPGRAARRFYERMGFHPAESAPPGPEGGSRQVYRRHFA
ncbi:MAG: GNAT family N-acetyltransferase [Chloroflexota bacterium]